MSSSKRRISAISKHAYIKLRYSVIEYFLSTDKKIGGSRSAVKKAIYLEEMLNTEILVTKMNNLRGDGWFYLSREKMKRLFSLDTDTLLRYDDEFIESGLIQKKRGSGLDRKNYYKLNHKMVEHIIFDNPIIEIEELEPKMEFEEEQAA